MTAYEELLEFGSERIFEFLKNAKLHESQFKYSEFNNECYKYAKLDDIDAVITDEEPNPEIRELIESVGVDII